MLIARTGAFSLREAIATTFDGQHPCRMCHFVQKQVGPSDQGPRATLPTVSVEFAGVSRIELIAPELVAASFTELISHLPVPVVAPATPPPKSFLPS
jgi:hypothetical protein